jgi:hypothetical protein
MVNSEQSIGVSKLLIGYLHRHNMNYVLSMYPMSYAVPSKIQHPPIIEQPSPPPKRSFQTIHYLYNPDEGVLMVVLLFLPGGRS